MIQNCLLILFLASLFGPAQAQENSRRDLSGNFYYWNSHSVEKKSPSRESLFSWQNPTGGVISWVDPADPFRILCFSRETNEIIWLDNKLVPIGQPIALDRLNILRINGICSSRDGGIWLVNPGANKLLKLSNRLEVQLEVPMRLPPELNPESWLPMLEWKQMLYLIFPDNKILVTDLYGQTLKQIPLKARTLDLVPEGPLFITPDDSLLYNPDRASWHSLIKKPGSTPSNWK